MTCKKVRDTAYVHVSNIGSLSEVEQYCLAQAERAADVRRGKDYNVAKVTAAKERVSLLLYATFFVDAFPSLETAWTLDLAARTVRERSYRKSGNPPILHRKELLLEPTHPRIPEYRALTKSAERAGLFRKPSTIGFKRQWEQRLEQAGLRVEGHRLVAAGHRTENGHVSRSKA